MRGIAALFNQTVSVETRLGSGAYGDAFADPVDVACFISEKTQLVRDLNADEVVSSTTLYAPLATAPDATPQAGQFADGSRVMIANRTTRVITASRQNSAGPARIHHVQVHLT